MTTHAITKKDLGRIELKSNVYITDPGYQPDYWCCKRIPVLPGTYNCSVHTAELKNWGKRTVSIKIIHENYSDEEINRFPASRRRKYIDDMFVDSGQAGFFNEAYFDSSKNANEEKWYNRVCEITLRRENPHETIDDRGVVTDAGLGDGAYPCFAWKNKKKGQTIALEIIFLTDADIKDINSTKNEKQNNTFRGLRVPGL